MAKRRGASYRGSPQRRHRGRHKTRVDTFTSFTLINRRSFKMHPKSTSGQEEGWTACSDGWRIPTATGGAELSAPW